jgi:ankyrin repeat protein
MNAANNLSSTAHAINSSPVSDQVQLTDDKTLINGSKVKARKDDAQRTALLNSLPEKSQAATAEKAVEKGNSANNSSSVRSTPPNYVRSAGDIKSKAQSEFNKPSGLGTGPAMWVEANMDNMFYPSKSPLEIFKNFLATRKENNVNRPLSFEKRESYLGIAAKLNQTEIVQFLIEKNASVVYRDNDNKTALDIARENRSLESMQILAQHGAELTDADIAMIKEKSLSNIASKIDVDMPEENKTDLLLIAVYDSDLETIQQLLNEGIDPQGIGEKAMSPMSMALRMNNKEVLSLLRSKQS